MVRLLVLILASDNEPCYIRFQSAWRRLMNHWPGIDWYFYKADPNQTEPIVETDHCITVRQSETTPGVYSKSLAVFRYLTPRLSNYDFVLRPNLSTFFYFDRYLKLVETLPKQWVMLSVPCGVDRFHSTIPSGCCMGFTPDIIQRLGQELPPYVFLDDVSIGVALRKWGIMKMHLLERFDICNSPVTTPAVPTTATCVRIKGDDRSADVRVFEDLLRREFPDEQE